MSLVRLGTSCVLPFLGILVPGCMWDVVIGSSAPPDKTDELLHVTCAGVSCAKILVVAAGDLKECFGYDSSWPADEPGGWPSTAPPEVVAQCDPPAGTCEIVVYETTLLGHEACGCETAELMGDGCACCEPPTDEEASLEYVLAGEALQLELVGCLGEAPSFEAPRCEPFDDRCGEAEGPCKETDTLTRSNAWANLVLDSEGSYVTIVHGTSQGQVQVSGSGFIGGEGEPVLRAIVFAESARVGSLSLENWVFSFTEPVVVDDGATLNVPHQAEFVGWGVINGVPWHGWFPLSNDGIGWFDKATSTWGLDYTERNGANLVTVHLVGTYDAGQ